MVTESASVEGISLRVKSLHLPPRSNKTQRVWYIGEGQLRTTDTDPRKLKLDVIPQNHKSFSSLKAVLKQLKPLAQPHQLPDLAKIENYLHEACPGEGGDGTNTHGQLLADSVAYAIMRRISRESFYTGRLIELAAKTINAILCSLPDCREVHVNHLDQLDRPSIKVLARAMLLLKRTDGFAWVWHTSCHPLQTDWAETGSIYIQSRLRLLRQIVGILSPTVVIQPKTAPSTSIVPEALMATTFDIAAALVVQNYDACFLWCDDLASYSDREVAERHRLRALAAVNIEHHDAALDSLSLAEQMSGSAVRQAHLCYLKGLVETKRRYDLASSTWHYTRGLDLLDSCHAVVGEDVGLERAWLMNGLALNEAVTWRRNPSENDHYKRAFALERDAFALVRDGESPARTYLRFNLLANSAFLLEMSRNYELAIQTLLRAFDFDLDESAERKQVWRNTLGYRVGVLHFSAGAIDNALRLLRDSAKADMSDESWPTREKVLRALGTVLFHNGQYTQAAEVFASGLEMCRSSRAAQGAREHARNLILSLLRDDQKQRAGDVYEELLSEEGLEVFPREVIEQNHSFEDLRPSPLSPKLPAYFPELDLEGIPSIDLNLFLGNRQDIRKGPVSPWK
ncbi:MAG TPA: hypothetical protein VN844_22360 [Pyrinomonadaceae bacterium]|nr:hypothetical protein [Pyrinomonadaceae bacterium]